jgi:hypothetical protein
MPRFRPIPPPLGRPRVRPVRAYARFYALAEDRFGKTVRTTFNVRVDKYMPRMKYHWVAIIANMVKEKQIPACYSGQVFDGFPELVRIPWVRVRKVLKYKAGVQYAR